MSNATINATALDFDRDGSSFTARQAAIALDPRIVSGTLGSVVSSFFSQPFEVAKVKQQNYRPVQGSHPGVLLTLRQVIAREGICGAYAGIAPTVLMSLPNYGIFLVANDEVVSFLKGQSWLSDNTIPLVSGAVARLMATTAVAPLELLRTRDASLVKIHHTYSQPAWSRVGGELRTILKEDGLRALYRGLAPSLLRDVPFAAVYMLCLERFREASRPLFKAKEHPNSTCRQACFEFTNAALAGMIAAFSTAPLDVVKTRLQSVPQHGEKSPPRSTLKVLRSVICKEGLGGLWRGNQARMMKVAPQYAIMISCYEVGKDILA